MAGEKKYIALEETSQDILSKIGTTDDSETTETIFGKENRIDNKIDNLKQLGFENRSIIQNGNSDILSALGQTGNTGGTATSGSVYAKLNAIISAINGGYRFYEGSHIIAEHDGGTENFSFNITPTCSGKITVMATLTGKSTSSSKPAVELKADGTTILSITNSSSVATETKTAALAVSAGTAITISGVMVGYRTGITDIKFMADVISDKADITIN
nr:MAG TPA: hypothetical protein [Caudoviricetes sp.]